MEEVVQPIPAHAILVLLVQLAGLLVLARVLAEVMRRLGQPAVLGELLAGMLLGPTILGHFAPGVFEQAFPPSPAQFHLLEAISWLGMIHLLLLTGLETDVRTVKHLGRPAFMASLFGMVVPFGMGLALGWLLPDHYLADPTHRYTFAFFLATAMAISAMPVIAKILMDLRLIRRNIGVVILSAGVVDDTTGWLILSLIAGIAAGGTYDALSFGKTVALLGAYLIGIRWVVYPLLGRALQFVNEHVAIVGADLTLILGFTLMSAAATEAIGVHAVFGAFVAGLVVRQLPRVRAETLRSLEVFVLAALSPLFFAYVGLKVDLWALRGWQMPAAVIGIAVAGKMVGCYIGGRLGRLTHWESLAIGFGMNARGAMELIVALIGLSLGILTEEMYSTIVLVAVLTSFAAPLLLRMAVPHLPLEEEEKRRLAAEAPGRLVRPAPHRVLTPIAAGMDPGVALRLALPLAAEGGRVVALAPSGSAEESRLSWAWTRRGRAAVLARLEEVSAVEPRLRIKRTPGGRGLQGVMEEAARDYDFLVLGGPPDALLRQRLARDLVERAALTTVLVRAAPVTVLQPYASLLVPVDGSAVSRYAAELAFGYAQETGSTVTLAHVIGEARMAAASVPVFVAEAESQPDEVQAAAQRVREEFAAIAAAYDVAFETRIIPGRDFGTAVIAESRVGRYDLVLIGAENKLFGRPLLFGQGAADIFEAAQCDTAIVIPRLEEAGVAKPAA